MAPPVPVEITKDGHKTKVIVQTTKQGMIWILDEKTGQPALPYEERPVTQSRIPGEVSSPTQPFTVSPPPLSDAIVHRDRLSMLSDRANAECTALFDSNKLADAGPFNPPRPDGAWSIMSVGATGGIDWGGVSIDRDHGAAIANVTNLPTMITVNSGTGGVAGNNGLRSTSGNVRFMDNDGRSCNGGRQGELVSVDLATGSIRWRVALGSLEDEYGARARDMGATNIGPSLVTHGGVVFIGAATDDRIHAYDTQSGRLLWQMKMPASANAGPMTYMGKDGRQYVVIAAGGPGNARRPSARESRLYRQTLIAFALPRPGDKALDLVAAYPPHVLGPGESLQMQGGAGNALLATGAAQPGRGRGVQTGRGRGGNGNP
jgi:quinoprotein glucose dehydrogenase